MRERSEPTKERRLRRLPTPSPSLEGRGEGMAATGRFRTYAIIFAPQANTPTLSMNLITEIGFET